MPLRRVAKRIKPMSPSQTEHPVIIPMAKVPLEILEMIIGFINFADLPNFFRVCKWINAAFKETKYWTQLKVVAKYDYDSLHDAYRQMKRNSRTVWQVRDVLKAFVGAYCECGNIAWMVNWLNDPPMRLCQRCFRNKKYHCTHLTKTLKKFDLTKRDIKNIPTIVAGEQRTPLNDFNPMATLIQTSVVEDIARHKGRRIDHHIHLNTIAVSCLQMYDYRKGTAYGPLGCYICEPTKAPFFARKFNCPRNYESIRTHIVNVHPEVLDIFEAGWNALGTDMQQSWQAFGNKYNLAWRSWPHVAFRQIQHEFEQKKGKLCSYLDLLKSTHDEVDNLISSKLSQFFNLPDTPETQDIRDNVSALITETIIRKEVVGVIERLKEKTERDGITAWREYLSEYKLEGMQSP